MNQTLVILTNYTRPDNLPPIIRAFREQTVPVDIVVVDNAPLADGVGKETKLREGYPEPSFKDADDVWRFTRNAGPPCRFAPAFMDNDHEFFLFFDDDMLPGVAAVEHLVKTAERIAGPWATLGEIGRIYDNCRYVSRNIRRWEGCRPVDMTARAHFVEAKRIGNVLETKRVLIDKFGDEARRLLSVHDDILLCQSAQLRFSLRLGNQTCSYLTPKGTSETLLRSRDLDDGKTGVSRRPNFLAERNRLIEMMHVIGWRSEV